MARPTGAEVSAAALLLVALALALGAAAKPDAHHANHARRAEGSQEPHLEALQMRTHVTYRWARTVVNAEALNPSDEERNYAFHVAVPDTAYITSLNITVGGETFRSSVRDNPEWTKAWAGAAEGGAGAAWAATAFEVPVALGRGQRAVLALTYEEILRRERGQLRLRLLLDPRQVVPHLSVVVHLREATPLLQPRLLRLSSADSHEGDDVPADEDAQVTRPSPTEAVVRWAPSAERQRGAEGKWAVWARAGGPAAQLRLLYDVERADSGGAVLYSGREGGEGFFAHFVAPPAVPAPRRALPLHVVFVRELRAAQDETDAQLSGVLSHLLTLLRRADAFSVVLYDESAAVYEGGEWRRVAERAPSPDALFPARNESIAAVQQAAAAFSGGAGAANMTAGLAAARAVASLVPQRQAHSVVVLLTRGEVPVAPFAPEGPPVFVLHPDGEAVDRVALRRLAVDGGVLRLPAPTVGARADVAAAECFFRGTVRPAYADVNVVYNETAMNTEIPSCQMFPSLSEGSEVVVVSWGGNLQPQVVGRGVVPSLDLLGWVPTELLPPPQIIRLDPEERPILERMWQLLHIQEKHLQVSDAIELNSARVRARSFKFASPLMKLEIPGPQGAVQTVHVRWPASVGPVCGFRPI